ncbi:MAG: Wzz/FepE/Etk N-terminal domain-containing protein [Bacillota bacterium]
MEDEIDLRQYAELLWRNRHVIVAVTLAAALVTFVVSRLWLPRVYEASVLLVVESPQPDQASQEQLAAPVRAVALAPAGYQQIVQSPAFQSLVQDQVRQATGAGEPVPSVRIRARVVPQTNLLELTAQAPQPNLAARWANMSASLLLQEVDTLNRTRMQGALTLLEGQIAETRRSLDEAVKALQEFTRDSPSVQKLANEQAAKLELVSTYQSRLGSLDLALAAETTRLQALRDQLGQQPRIIALKKAFSPEGAALTQTLRNLGGDAGNPLISLEDEQINPVYVELQQQVAAQEATVAGLRAEREQAKAALAALTGEIQRLTAELVRLQAREKELTWQAETARRSYEAAVSQYQAQKSALAGRLGESTLTLVRQAVAPDSPARPRVLLNTTVATFLGLMASVFGVFFAEFWRQPVAGRSSEAVVHGAASNGQ